MPKKIRFQLALADGTKAGSLEALKKHFDLESVISYYNNGDLLTWLRDRNIEAEADAVEALDATAPDFQEKLCTIFGAAYVGPIDMEELASRQKRIERLRKYTDDDAIIKNIDSVAFDQEELADLLDADLKEIYLCGDNFTIPVSLKGKTYIGVNQPHIRISGKSQEQELSGINVIDCIIDSAKKESEKSNIPIEDRDLIFSDDNISEKMADRIFNTIVSGKYSSICADNIMESDDYFIFIKDRSDPWSSEKVEPKGIYAVSKRSGNELLLIKEEDYPHKVLYDFERWSVINNSVIAYFSDDIVGEAHAYLINIPEQKILSLSLSIDPYDCYGTNGKIFLIKDNQGQCYSIDVEERKKYPLQHEPQTKVVLFTKSSVYFCAYNCSQKNDLVEYNFIKKRERVVAELPSLFCGTISYYNGKIIFFFKNSEDYPMTNYNIGYVDISTEFPWPYHRIENSVQIYTESVKTYRDGCIFVANKQEWELQLFEFKNLTFTTIAEDCGYRDWYKGGLFERSHWLYHTNPFLRIGNWIYYEQGAENAKAKVSIERPMSVELLGEDL